MFILFPVDQSTTQPSRPLDSPPNRQQDERGRDRHDRADCEPEVEHRHRLSLRPARLRPLSLFLRSFDLSLTLSLFSPPSVPRSLFRRSTFPPFELSSACRLRCSRSRRRSFTAPISSPSRWSSSSSCCCGVRFSRASADACAVSCLRAWLAGPLFRCCLLTPGLLRT